MSARPAGLMLSRLVAPALILSMMVSTLAAQQRGLTTDDYARAERAGGRGTLNPGGTVTPNWLPNDRMWYRDSSATGVRFMLVDPARKTKLPAFDHVRLAAALSRAAGASFDGARLPFQELVFSADLKAISVNVAGRGYACDTRGSSCRVLAAAVPAAAPADGGTLGGRGGRGGGRGGVAAGVSSDAKPLNMSPDGKRGVVIRNYNLWLHDNVTNRETQLTRDGVTDFGYATDNAGWVRSDRAYGVWSPDGHKFATNQQDERNVGMVYVVSTPLQGGHPVLTSWHHPFSGDTIVTTIQRVVIDVDNAKVVRLRIPPDQHRSAYEDNIQSVDLIWNPDGTRLGIVSTERNHQSGIVRIADAVTGDVRPVFIDTIKPVGSETQATEFEMWVPWRILWASNEVVWYSQRDNYGHLYLYDLNTGQLKNKITTGNVVVTAIDLIDEKARTVWFTGLGGTAGEVPYYTHFYRVNLDGTHQVEVTPGEGNHDAARLSPDRNFLVDTWSRTDVPPQSALRDANTGALLVPLEQGDKAKLLAAGWHPVTTIRMKGRDGKTEIDGLMYTPTNLDSNRKYPIINHIFPGPQVGSVSGTWGFRPGGGEPQGLAELGFIVVEINGMGTPGRTKEFQDTYFGHLGDNTIPDQVSGMKDLAQQYRFIDIDKAGVYGHSGGGFATASAMFRHPDFFKVGISESGNHDNKDYEDDWGERHIGLLKMNPDGTDNYTMEASAPWAKNLKGKLLLIHGTTDNNVPPNQTYHVVDALIKANRDFDLLMLPNQGHGYNGVDATYTQRRRWDYFVRYLMGVEPPNQYEMGTGGAGRGGRGGRGGGGR